MRIASPHKENFTTLTNLVNESAMFSNMSTFSSRTLLLYTISLTKWYCTSKCLFFEWKERLFAKNIVLWLLQLTFITLSSNLIPEHNLCSHISSFLPWLIVVCSNSMVDNDTNSYHLLIQLISPPNILKTYLLVSLRRSISPTQTMSTKPSTFNLPLSLLGIPW